MENVRGTKTSVHVGSFTDDFKTSSWRDPQQIQTHSIVGIAASILSGRLSSFFDLRGQSMSINTACSSSLVALALSCNCLWSGDSDLVIILLLTHYPEAHIIRESPPAQV